MNQDFDVTCPGCGESIRLNETLAGPAISRIRLEAEVSIKLAHQEAEAKVQSITILESALAAKELELFEKEASVNTQVNQALAAERTRLVAATRENLMKELSPEIDAARAHARDLQDKLSMAQRAELQLRKEKDDIDKRAEDLDLEVARKVDAERKSIHAQACKETEEAGQRKLTEAERKLADLETETKEKRTLANNLAATLAAKELELSDKDASIKTQISQALSSERVRITTVERENILRELSPELEAEREKSEDLKQKLDTARRAELVLRQEKEAIDERAQNLDLEIARRIDQQRKTIQENAAKDSEHASRLKLAEKDKTIADMQLKLQEAQRKAVQGSQQLQGEILELDFEASLRQWFPQDTIEPVKTGARGGDILQRVLGQMSRPVGTIFWETKRAQTWVGDWTTKAKQDAAIAKADVILIVSEVLPKGVRDGGLHDGVWCVLPTHAVMFGLAIRQGIISTAEARQGVIGRETKKERLYDYMIGPEFRTTIEGIALPFKELYDELAAEKRSTLSRWKRQEKRLERVLANIAGLQGDLQGIGGSEMPQISGFELEVPEDRLLQDASSSK